MALDEAYDDFNEVFDKYVETAIAIYGRSALTSTSIINELCPDEFLLKRIKDEFLVFNKALEKINGDNPSLDSLYSDIRDIQNQLLYRLSFTN